ncbi:putative guanyl-specific ribonuclease [Triangularia verruculosa]|uniref:ribonuclease T1 n=1 Tax=Triangularia verruculosa TaxID=2587418 RepID=A0AAN6XE58_9PEZI|nr:putative guanyl-specific ribonuclease [Triangularia verruculosa]
MVQFLPALVTLLSVVAVSAAPVSTDVEAAPALQERACAYTCGTVCYQTSHITAARNKGHQLRLAGQNISQSPFLIRGAVNINQASDSYPHRYNNYEGFNFPTPAPWYEYPIMKTYAVYNGGSPGPDRVIFDSNGAFDKLITHTGASGNAFVACT